MSAERTINTRVRRRPAAPRHEDDHADDHGEDEDDEQEFDYRLAPGDGQTDQTDGIALDGAVRGLSYQQPRRFEPRRIGHHRDQGARRSAERVTAMATRDGDGQISVAERFPVKHLARPEVRPLPEPPSSTWRIHRAGLTYFANLWPGWATSSATLVTYLWGGSVRWIAIGMLVAIGLILTLAPVVYVALERAEMLKIAAVLVLVVVGALFAISVDAWSDLPQILTNASILVESLGFALLLGALAFAGGGGGQNLVPSNWIRTSGSAWAATCHGSPAR